MSLRIVYGKAGSGKGEIAKLIKEYYIYKLEKCVITEYSKEIKILAQELSDWDGSNNTKPRAFLQQLGDEIRAIDEKFFVKDMLEKLRIYEKFTNNVVISGVRYPIEIEEIKLNYDNVYTICVENQFGKSTLSVEEQMHRSETALDDYQEFDYIIANDDKDKLKEKIFKFLEGIE